MVKHAAVRADAAVRVGKLDLQVVDGLASRVDTPSIPARSRAKERRRRHTHNACNVWTDDVSADPKRSNARSTSDEGATLNNAVLANLAEVAEQRP